MNICSSGNLTRLILNNDRSIFIPDFLVKIYSDFEPLTKKIIQERVGIDDVFLDIERTEFLDGLPSRKFGHSNI